MNYAREILKRSERGEPIPSGIEWEQAWEQLRLEGVLRPQADSPDPLRWEQGFGPELLSWRCERPVHFLASCPSTNAVAWQLAEGGAEEGVLVIADQQTSGRGRLDRSWHSPPGENLYVSMVLRPQLPLERVPLVGLAAALGLIEGLEGLHPGLSLQLKWPNDILSAEGKKLAGFLSEIKTRGSSLDFLILGWGLNVKTSAFPDFLPQACSLAQLTGEGSGRAGLLEAVLPRMQQRMDQVTGAAKELLQDLSQRCTTIGRTIAVDQHRGEAVGLSAEGCLLLRDEQGLVRKIFSGDVLSIIR